MAWAVLKGLGATAQVSSATVDAAKEGVTGSGCAVSEVKRANGKVEFDRLDEALPMPMAKAPPKIMMMVSARPTDPFREPVSSLAAMAAVAVLAVVSLEDSSAALALTSMRADESIRSAAVTFIVSVLSATVFSIASTRMRNALITPTLHCTVGHLHSSRKKYPRFNSVLLVRRQSTDQIIRAARLEPLIPRWLVY